MKGPKLPRLAAALAIALAALPPRPLAAHSAFDGAVDFPRLLRLAELNRSVRVDSPERIRRKWAGVYDKVAVVEVKRTRNRYVIGTDDATRTEDIAIRGTTNFRNLLYDIRFAKRWNPELGIFTHHGFAMMASALHRSIVPRLEPGYSIRMSGQSLGAAEALILAMMLSKEGYRVAEVVTFGQPKVTDAYGARRYAYLPLTRVVDQNDPVPLLPPPDFFYRRNPYVHFGREIMLLRGPYYCLAPPGAPEPRLPRGTLTLERLAVFEREHSIRTYVRNLRGKIGRSIEVPFSERLRYVEPQYRY